MTMLWGTAGSGLLVRVSGRGGVLLTSPVLLVMRILETGLGEV